MKKATSNRFTREIITEISVLACISNFEAIIIDAYFSNTKTTIAIIIYGSIIMVISYWNIWYYRWARTFRLFQPYIFRGPERFFFSGQRVHTSQAHSFQTSSPPAGAAKPCLVKPALPFFTIRNLRNHWLILTFNVMAPNYSISIIYYFSNNCNNANISVFLCSFLIILLFTGADSQPEPVSTCSNNPNNPHKAPDLMIEITFISLNTLKIAPTLLILQSIYFWVR